MAATSNYQLRTTVDSGLEKTMSPNGTPSPNSRERSLQLQAACEMLRDLVKRRQSTVSNFIQPKANPTERLEYDKITTGILASKQADQAPRAQALENLQIQWLGQDRDISEVERKMQRLKADIIRLQAEDTIDRPEVAKQEKRSRWDRMLFLVFGATSPSSKEWVAKRKRGINRQYSIRIKKDQMRIEIGKLSALKTAIQMTETAVEELDQEIQLEEQREEDERAALTEWEYAKCDEQTEKMYGSCDGIVSGNIEIRY
ncbi:hypothetical protein F4803DRAFT_549616 [Xylaria telfairii]|nr:hypothetical protein F4803DRAFT_549616 [Xylaria telfairii]